MCKFTIAIPVYNGSKNILNSVCSALKQDCNFKFEILVVDNNSNDETADILNRFLNKIELVKNLKTVSMYENHNICLKKSRGDYVLFCHSDDMLKKSALNILHKEISAYDFPDKFVIWGRSFFRDFEKNYRLGGGDVNKILAGMNSVKPFLYGGLTPSGTCYSKESFLDLGGFLNCNHRLAPADWTTMMMLALEGFEFKMIDRLLFQRTFASTLVTGTDQRVVRTSLVDAISELQKKLSKEKFDRLVDISRDLSIPPLEFYYACVKNGILCDRIRYILIKKLIKRPSLVRNDFVRRIFFMLN